MHIWFFNSKSFGLFLDYVRYSIYIRFIIFIFQDLTFYLKDYFFELI